MGELNTRSEKHTHPKVAKPSEDVRQNKGILNQTVFPVMFCSTDW